MGKKKNKKFSLKGKIGKSIEKYEARKSKGSGYLNLPDGVNLFKEMDCIPKGKRTGKVVLDFLPYEVTIDNHPEKNEEIECCG